MDFSNTEEQQMLQESVQKFVYKSYDFDTRNKIIATEKGFSDENWELFAELGWLTVPFQEEDGGFGGSAVDLVVMMEEFGKAMLVEPFVATTVLAGGLISEQGSAQQKAELLPKIMEGKLQLACAYAEPGSRFNLANIKTSAVADGDNIVLNGSKTAVLNGSNAEVLLVVARESGAATDTTGVSVFMVDATSAGVSIQAFANVDGKKSAEITLKDVSVSATARLGEAGSALSALTAVVDRATLAVSAEAVGAMEAMLHKTVEYSKTRKQFGTAIGTFQALQHRMADMFIECQLARSIAIMAAMKLDGGEDATEKSKSVSAAKSRIGKAINKVGQEAIQIHGGIAMTEELDVGHLFKLVTAAEIMFGNTDYHTERFASL
ncbi:acyl-CoA dehydrogenase [Gammaproteobacteria bacterium]|nr:acyl-CoA dehydrogenase family protein [Pseudomonadales bacterium]MDC0413665.1 acyl-CoA dehydrogenase [Gammaproteobacteria bacterium]MDC3196769.1 acyl-CoA dehydrogenase [Gammaproteobacteria bacterium]HAS47996.1 pimeloyl-CoA dehydrogenase small subunit [Gammaproteobacteria bacterium]